MFPDDSKSFLFFPGTFFRVFLYTLTIFGSQLFSIIHLPVISGYGFFLDYSFFLLYIIFILPTLIFTLYIIGGNSFLTMAFWSLVLKISENIRCTFMLNNHSICKAEKFSLGSWKPMNLPMFTGKVLFYPAQLLWVLHQQDTDIMITFMRFVGRTMFLKK